jgi:hypothetical protein
MGEGVDIALDWELRRNWHLTARSISASIGEWANRRFRIAAG